MKSDGRVLIQLLVASLIGLVSVVGTLLLLSQGASAGPMPDPVTLLISEDQIADSIADSISEDPADLAVTKSDDPDPVTAGETLTYTLTVTNNGPDPATGIVLTDTLPSGVTFVSARASQGSCSRSSGIVICTLSNLGTLHIPTAIVNIVVTVDSSTTGSLSNSATVSGNETDPDPSNNTDTESTNVNTEVDLSVTKTDDHDPVTAGDSLTYEINFANSGPSDATGVVVTDTLDSNVIYVGANPMPDGGTPDAPYWSIGNLPPGEPGQIRITVTVASPLPNGTVLANTAWLDADQTTPLSATQETTVHSSPVLTITKTGSPDPVDAGGTLHYTLIITNSGNENATSVTVTEHYDPNVSFSFSTPRPNPGSENQWTFSTVAVGNPQTIDIIVTVASPLPVGTVLTNQATLDSDQTTPITVTEVTAVTTASELTVSKVDLSDPVQAGEDLVYFITYQNAGTAPADDVVITETYDSRVTFLSANPAPESGTDNVWNVGDLLVNENGTVVVTVRVDTPLVNGTILTNRVTIDSAYTSPRTHTETTSVRSAPDLTFSVTDQPDPVEAGASLDYTLRCANTGNADATQVVVTATLDSNVSYSSATPEPAGGSDDVWYWEIGDIPGAGGCDEIVIHTSVTFPLTNGTTLDFAAQLGDAEGDFLEDTTQTTIGSAPVLSLHKSDGLSTVYAGDLLTYTLTYTNSGNENIYNVTITDTLPDYVEYIGCEIGNGDCQHVPSDEVIFHIPTIIAQTSGQARLVVRVDDPLPAGAASVINHARLTAPSLPVPIDAQDVDQIGTLPDLTVAAAHEPSLFSPGELMTYTVTYGNAGHMHAEDVIITTTLPPDTTYVGQGWTSSDGQTYTYVVGNLPSGAGYQAYFAVGYPDQPQIGAPEFNTPFVIGESGSSGDANPGDNSAYVYIGVPDLIVADFTVEPIPLESNQPVTFTIVVENQGTGMAWNPDNGGGFWVDVFIAPVASYPWERYSEKNIFASVPPLAPGLQYTLVITYGGFSEHEISEEIEQFYAKVDNYAEPIFVDHKIIGWTRFYGIVPECDEMNNLGGPIHPQLGPNARYIFLPLVLK